MGHFFKSLLTAFGSAAIGAVIQGVTTQDGLMGNPKQTAVMAVTAGLIGVANHWRTPPNQVK
jgi:hypothetical protein